MVRPEKALPGCGRSPTNPLPPSGQTFSCAPIVVNNVVLAGSSGGDFFAFRASDGKRRYHLTLPQALTCGEYFAVPLVGLGAGDGIVVVPAGNTVVALGDG